MFTLKPPSAPKVEQEIEITPPPESEIGTISQTKPSESELIPLVLKTLEQLKQENEVVRSCLDKQDDMFKEQAHTNTKTKGLLQVILSRLLPQAKTKTFFVMLSVSN